MTTTSAASIVLALAAACSEPRPPTLPGTSTPPCAVTRTWYLIDGIQVLDSPAGSLDLDGDGVHDNALGRAIQGLVEAGADPAASFAEGVSSEQHLVLLGVDRCAGESFARVELRLGASVTPTGSIQLETSEPSHTVPAVGVAAAGTVLTSLGTGDFPPAALIDVAAMRGEAISSVYVTTRIDSDDVAADAITGELGLALPRDGLAERVAPAISRTLNALLAADPGCPAMCANTFLRDTVGIFDDDANGEITTEEVVASAFFTDGLLHPDLDALSSWQGEIVFWPDHDHTADACSLIVGFSASRVTVVE